MDGERLGERVPGQRSGLRLAALAVASLALGASALVETPLAVAGEVEDAAGRFWFHKKLPRAEDRTQALVLKEATAGLPGLCGKAPVRYREKERVVRARARFEGCKTWNGSNAVVVARVDKETDSVLRAILKVPRLDIEFPVKAGKSYGESLRVATYNVQMLPSNRSAATSEATAARIADRIKAAGYDVIALNEAFDEDIRDVFIEELKGSFPHRVHFLGGGTVPNEDSGLMLFSRLPFLLLPDSTFSATNGTCRATKCTKVAFREFQACGGDDCFAEKGVGLVRLGNPQTNSVLNVAFTHMQASYAPASYPDELEDPDQAIGEVLDRAAQVRDIKGLLKTTLGGKRLKGEPVVIMGDTNIDGDLANPDLGGHPNYNRRNIHEWTERMSDTEANSKFLPFVDGWAFDNAPKWTSGNLDRGITNVSAWGAEADGARLDYVLLNGEQSRRCMQHMTLSHNLRHDAPLTETGFGPEGIGMGGRTDLSDHIGVNADINLTSSRCSPVEAQASNPPEGQISTFTGNLRHPGEIEWFRIALPGTYSIELSGAPGTDYRIYEATDMSTPAPNYKEETTSTTVDGVPITGKQFRITKAPFFIRVWNRDRAKTGPFTLKVLRHDCSTKETACALAPGERRDVELPADPPLNSADEKWFEFYTEDVPGTGAQALRAIVSGLEPAGSPYFEAELIRAGSPDSSVGTDDATASDPDAPGTEMLEIGAEERDAQKYYLVVRRVPESPPPYPTAARRYQVRWETDLTILFGAGVSGGTNSWHIRCLEENDGAIDDGDDEVYLRNVSTEDTVLLNSTEFVGNFDAGNQRGLEPFVPTPIVFRDNVLIQGFEDDGGAAGDDDRMIARIPALRPETQGPVAQSIDFTPQDGISGDPGDGNYRIYYNLTHGFDHR